MAQKVEQDIFAELGMDVVSGTEDDLLDPQQETGGEGSDAHLPPSTSPTTSDALPEAETSPPASSADIASQAEAFQRLVTDENYRRAFLAAIGASSPGTTQPTGDGTDPAVALANQLTSTFYPGVTIEGTLEPNVIPAVEAASIRAVGRHLVPEVVRLTQRIQELEGRFEQQTISTQYPGAEKFMVQARTLRAQNPNLTMEQALRAVGGADLYQGKPSGLAPKARAQGQLTSRSVEARKPGTPTEKKFDMAEAIRQVWRAQGRDV